MGQRICTHNILILHVQAAYFIQNPSTAKIPQTLCKGTTLQDPFPSFRRYPRNFVNGSSHVLVWV